MKTLTALIAVLTACNSPGLATSPTPTPSVAPTPTASPARKGVSLHVVDGYASKLEREIIAKAEKKLNEVVASECFGEKLRNRKMIQTDGRTPAKVVEHLQSITGSVDVKMYFRCMTRSLRCLAPTSAVAYRQPPELAINLNRAAFYPELPLCDWVSTIGHEALGHALGNYDHDFNWNAQRDFSVPYSINAAIESCCK